MFTYVWYVFYFVPMQGIMEIAPLPLELCKGAIYLFKTYLLELSVGYNYDLRLVAAIISDWFARILSVLTVNGTKLLKSRNNFRVFRGVRCLVTSSLTV